jgi:alkanesulfonate monooxygenase SsuD/methylene tetrahydromethanopterin reductase-like flavin-dependent oxidoreductase (luciferase family)
MVTLAWLAGVTSSIELVINVLVLPLREVVVVAKEAMTLQELAGGRLVCGVGLGASRDEFRAVRPGWTGARRGDLFAEQLEALHLLLNSQHASFAGEHVQFQDVELAPRPAKPVPLVTGGNSPLSLERALAYGEGWIPFMPDLPLLEDARVAVAQARGDRAAQFQTIPLIAVAMDGTQEAARARFETSHFGAYYGARMGEGILDRNLIGTPDEVSRRIREYAAAGIDRLSLCFVGNSREDIDEQLDLFVKEVEWTPAR